MPVFEWLESSALAIWVGESLWGYPIMLGMHAIGLAIVVGIFVMLDLRMLRIIRGVSFNAFLSLFMPAWIWLRKFLRSLFKTAVNYRFPPRPRLCLSAMPPRTKHARSC